MFTCKLETIQLQSPSTVDPKLCCLAFRNVCSRLAFSTMPLNTMCDFVKTSAIPLHSNIAHFTHSFLTPSVELLCTNECYSFGVMDFCAPPVVTCEQRSCKSGTACANTLQRHMQLPAVNTVAFVPVLSEYLHPQEQTTRVRFYISNWTRRSCSCQQRHFPKTMLKSPNISGGTNKSR